MRRKQATRLAARLDPPTTAAEVNAFLTRLEDIVRAGFRAFVGLQNAHERVREEFGIPETQAGTARMPDEHTEWPGPPPIGDPPRGTHLVAVVSHPEPHTQTATLSSPSVWGGTGFTGHVLQPEDM